MNKKKKINTIVGSIGAFKEPKKDFILIVPNLAGVILGFLAFITAL